MRFGSLFSGIGGFDLGLERAGMGCAWQVEIDSKCREVLRRHWPDVPHHEDVTKIGGNTLEPVDLICGGFPCQDLSVAGRRAGLAGERSGLFFEFLRIVGELAPRWVLIENVPGLLSSNEGRDMGAVLDGLGQLGYGYAWRILDSQYFGVPQRRRRVFIVGRAGGVCPPEVLFEPESLPGDSPPSRETGQGVARPAQEIPASSIHQRKDDPVVMQAVHGTLRSNAGAARFCGTSELDQPVVLQTLRAEGHDASEDGTGRGTPIVPAPVGFSLNQRREGRLSDQSDALHQPSGTQLSGVLALQGGGKSSQGSQGSGFKEEQSFTLNLVDTHGVAGSGFVPRRLTPRECERLQAFPDDWTRYDSEDREITDSPRYRMLGNAVTVTVASWIGRRIMSENR